MSKIDLKEISTRAPEDIDKKETKEKIKELVVELGELQTLLFAEAKHSVLLVLQGMDASGKDGVIRKVFTSVNPQGVHVQSFKKPTPEELAHDFLWRIHKQVPEKGMIHIFNRSHYEDVLVTRVLGLIDDDTAKRRFKYINNFERMLEEAGTVIIKCYLHISEEEQQQRLKERLDDPTKNWKFNSEDLKTAKDWKKYRSYYEEVFENCNDIPWVIVPADQNWIKEYTVAKVLVKTLKKLDMKFPELKM